LRFGEGVVTLLMNRSQRLLLLCSGITLAGFGIVAATVMMVDPDPSVRSAGRYVREAWARITGQSVKVEVKAKSRRCAQNIGAAYQAALKAGADTPAGDTAYDAVMAVTAVPEEETQPKDPTDHMAVALTDARTSRDFFTHRPSSAPSSTEEMIHFFIDVYTNETAKSALLDGNKSFPADSVILKRKSLGPDGKDTQYFTGMKKNRPGYWPEMGDWKFFVLDGRGKQLESGKLQSCADCHTKWPERDFVSRNYFDAGAPGGVKTTIVEQEDMPAK
jgi:hypothetical protein